MTPLELTTAYATFASGARVRRAAARVARFYPSAAETVTRSYSARLPRRRVTTPQEAYSTTSLLETSCSKATAKRALFVPGVLVAGKTGTTNKPRTPGSSAIQTDFIDGRRGWGSTIRQPLG